MRLFDFAVNTFSQSGEDGMIAKLLEWTGEGSRRCMEFGAADGINCSNTAALWHDGWDALLVESDETLYNQLVANTERYKAHPVHTWVTTEGPSSVDMLVRQTAHWPDLDVLSIDVDGPDWHIWAATTVAPRIVVIEHNRSVPPEHSLRQADLAGTFGASARALVELGALKGYELVGLTESNLFFLRRDQMESLPPAMLRGLVDLFPRGWLSYLVTDLLGRTACLGSPPWGVSGPFLGDLVGAPNAPVPHSLPEVAGSVPALRHAYEQIHGQALWLGQWWHNPADPTSAASRELPVILRACPTLVLLDISPYPSAKPEDYDWIPAVAPSYLYRRHGNQLVALIRKADP